MRYPPMQPAAWAAWAVLAGVAPVLAQQPPPPRALDIRAASCPKPDYPRPALRAEVQGRTLVALTVGAAGEVSGVEVVRRSGDTPLHALLDAEAVRATAGCRFPPAEGLAPVRATLPYLWKIDD